MKSILPLRRLEYWSLLRVRFLVCAFWLLAQCNLAIAARTTIGYSTAFVALQHNTINNDARLNHRLLQFKSKWSAFRTVSGGNQHHRRRQQQQEEQLSSRLFLKNGSNNNKNDKDISTAKQEVEDGDWFADVFEAVTVPVQGVLDDVTDGWALSYADLSPDNTQTLPGQTFLATNTAYLVAGILLTVTGDFWFGFCTDLAAIASFNYHYQQLLSSGQQTADSVRIALLLDYLFALISILTALVYLLTSATTAGVSMDALIVSVAGCVCLGLSWVWEYGKPYMIWHSLWHLCSAYAGYLIGTEHYYNSLPK